MVTEENHKHRPSEYLKCTHPKLGEGVKKKNTHLLGLHNKELSFLRILVFGILLEAMDVKHINEEMISIIKLGFYIRWPNSLFTWLGAIHFQFTEFKI